MSNVGAVDSKLFIESLNKSGVSWLELHFSDLIGRIHHAIVPIKRLNENLIKEGIPKLDGSSIEGFGEISYSDFNLLPDINTFSILPWKTGGAKVGRVYVYVLDSFNKGPIKTDPRRVAFNLESMLKSDRKKVFIGPEAEFYIFTKVEIDFSNPSSGTSYYLENRESPWMPDGYPTTFKGSYCSGKHLDTVYEYRFRLAEILEKYFNIYVESHHHEVGAASQVEVNIKFEKPLKIADDFMTLKYVSREVGGDYGYYVTFMPKPVYGDNGSGLHTHISMWEGDENLFYDRDDEYAELSQYGRYFIGGLIEHGRSLSAIVSPTVNSYKRLVAGYEAPIYLAWSRGNRSAAIRIPIYKKGVSDSKRIEYRPPDPSINPYLAFSAIVLAGLDGVNRKIDPGDPVDKNIYSLDTYEMKMYGIRELPRDLYEALEELSVDYEYLKPIFSNELIETYIDIKRREYIEVEKYPAPSELYHYFSL